VVGGESEADCLACVAAPPPPAIPARAGGATNAAR
jgi:hypothetical protein